MTRLYRNFEPLAYTFGGVILAAEVVAGFIWLMSR